MALTPGTRLGAYEVVALIGEGGMGQVYKARDTRLDRIVAIKVLREHFANDPGRRARFDREARAISKLNDPHICTLYDVGHDNGVDYLIVEHLDGQTLADRLKKGSLPIEQAVSIAIDIASALDTAHRAGIIHRDLKPANVMLTRNGAKLLDFGIAREVSKEPITATITRGTITAEGMLLGTPQYMAPEQLEGREADGRSDIFAFGAVLYEMLSGRRAFAGDTQASVAAAVLDRDPTPLTDIPGTLDRVLRKSLSKDPEARWQTVRDLRDALQWTLDATHQTSPGVSGSRMWSFVASAGVIVLLGVGVRWWTTHRIEAPTAPVRLEIADSDKMRFYYGSSMTLSPDGRWVVFPAIGEDDVTRYWIRSLDSADAHPLPGTEDARTPAAWSWDSRYVIFTTLNSRVLRKVDISGGPPQQLIAFLPGVLNGATSRRDGTLLFGMAPDANTPVLYTSILRLAPGSGTPVQVTKLEKGETRHAWPQFLPDGRHFLYMRVSSNPGKSGVFVGSTDVKSEQQNLNALLLTNREAYFSPTPGGHGGHLVFLQDTTLMAQPFDPDTLQLSGEPEPIADGVDSFANAQFGLFSASESGALVYREGGSSSRLVLRSFDQTGKPVATFGEPGDYATPSMSPDGTRLAIAAGPVNARDIWTIDVGRGNAARLTFSANNTSPIWSPDGKSLAFASLRNGRTWTYIKAADGSGDEQLAANKPGAPASWSPDGRFLLMQMNNVETTHLDIWAVVDPRLSGHAPPISVLVTPFDESSPEFSPDGRWFAYVSNESGTSQVYVRPFSPDGVAGAKWLVSSNGGFTPHWSHDGKQLFYGRGANAAEAMVVDVETTGGFRADRPRRLFRLPPLVNTGGIGFARSSDTFVLVTRGSANREAPFTIALNWQAGLKSGR